MKQAIVLSLLICLCIAADDEDPASYVWDLGGGLHGNAAAVTKQINAGIEDAWAHYADMQAAQKQKQTELDTQTAATLQSVHDGAAYKSRLAEETKAEADQKKARDAGDTATAISAGAIVNQARADLTAMEKKALAGDHRLTEIQTALDEYTTKKLTAKTTLNKAAEWRSRILHNLRYGAVLTLPLVQDQEFFINTVKVRESTTDTLVLEMDIREEVAGSTKKNARGDGIDVATYEFHPIHVIIPRPAKCNAVAGSTLAIKAPYRLSGDFDNNGRLPSIHAVPDTDGKLAFLWKSVAEVKGPDKAYLDGVDDAVDKKEAKELEKLDKQK
jgi:hypothetical protein